jgi:hypothetical protein
VRRGRLPRPQTESDSPIHARQSRLDETIHRWECESGRIREWDKGFDYLQAQACLSAIREERKLEPEGRSKAKVISASTAIVLDAAAMNEAGSDVVSHVHDEKEPRSPEGEE